MGQRADEVGRRHGEGEETYVVRPGETRRVTAEGSEAHRMEDAEPVAARHEADEPGATEETEEIRAEMEHTRAELSQTIDAIQEKLAPDEIKEQAKDLAAEVAEQVRTHVTEAIEQATENVKQSVRRATIGRAEDLGGSAKEAGYSMMDTIRANPMPAALVGIGLGWLLKNNNAKRSHGSESYSGYRRSYGNYPGGYRRETAYLYPTGTGGYVVCELQEHADYGPHEHDSHGGVKSRVADAAGQVQDRAGRMVSGAGDVASSVASNASDMAGDVVSNAGDMVGNAGEFAVDAGTGLWETVRRNPIPAALAGISLGWLFMNASGNDEERYRYGEYGSSPDFRRGRYGYGYDYDAGGYDSSDEGIKAKVGDVAGQARESVSSAADAARSQVEHVGEQLSDLTDQAQYRFRRAPGQLERMVQENPLAVGAGALALGVAVGMALPETDRERELMGGARDKVMQRAQGVVEQAGEKIQQVTEQTSGPDAGEKIQRVAEKAATAAQTAAKAEAQNQGLAGQQGTSPSSRTPSGSTRP